MLQLRSSSRRAASATYSSNSIVSMSTFWETYTRFISYIIDTQITTLLTSSLGLDTKFTFETSISLRGLFPLTFDTSLAVSRSEASSQDLFLLSLSLPTIPKLSSLCCPLHRDRSLMTLSFCLCAPDLSFIVSQHAFTKITYYQGDQKKNRPQF